MIVITNLVSILEKEITNNIVPSDWKKNLKYFTSIYLRPVDHKPYYSAFNICMRWNHVE